MEIDNLFFKDVLRLSVKHGIIYPQDVERWYKYRDNRNFLVHDYGEQFAEKTIKILPNFIKDARTLLKAINEQNDSKK